ncbi:MAG TPA: hypothetical protein VNK82_06490 [Terriglobales bacterium]|nr:hypothetical protein [Terriglobales bacterium]
MTLWKRTIPLVVVCLLANLEAQRRRDPLTDPEVDQLRELAQDPPKRLRLMLQFARERWQSLQAARAGSDSPNRALEVGERLRDFGALMAELEANVEAYSRKGDVRKPLREIIQATNQFKAGLEAMQEAARSDPVLSKEAKHYEYALEDVLDTVNSNLETSLLTLEQQEEAIREAKKRKRE